MAKKLIDNYLVIGEVFFSRPLLFSFMHYVT